MLTLAGQSSRRIKEGLAAFSAFFEKAAADSVRVDEKKLYFSELRRLAGPANRMVDERQRFEEKLRSELEMRSMIQVSLEESEGKLKNLFSSIRDVIIVADNDGVVVVPKAKAQQIIAKAKKQLQAEKQLSDLMENEGLTCFQALTRVVGEITPTLGGDGEIEIF